MSKLNDVVTVFEDVQDEAENVQAQDHSLKRNKFIEAFRSMFVWYPSNYDPEERKLLLKMDLSILVFGSLSYFVKTLDSSNVRNAYVSGMKEALNMNGNELNWFTITFQMGYVIGQIPGLLLLSRPKISKWVLPTLEVVYGVLTLCQSQLTNTHQLYAIRFLIGLAEAPSYAGILYVLGKWYGNQSYRNNPAELFVRAGTWYFSSGAGSMFSGYLQAAAYKNLNGVHGYEGWQWLFLIDGIITIPLAFLGYIFWPGIPESGKPWYFKKEEYELALRRTKRYDLKESTSVNFDAFKRTFKDWKWYAFVFNYTIQGIVWTPIYYFSLWLSAKKTYTVAQINTYPTACNAIAAVGAFVCTALLAVVPFWSIFLVGSLSIFIASIIMTIYNVPDGAVFFAFYISYLVNITAPVIYSYANVILREDSEQKAIVFASMMAATNLVYVWLALALFPTSAKNPHRAAPEWNIGWPVCIGLSVVMFASFLLIDYLHKRDIRNGTAFKNQKPLETFDDPSFQEITDEDELSIIEPASYKLEFSAQVTKTATR